MKKLLFLTIVSVLLVRCNTDELQDLNINPQAVNQIDLNFMFSAALLGIASNGSSGDNRYIDWRTNIGLCAHAIQHLGNANSGGISPGDKYTDNGETRAAPFEMSYRDQLKNIAEVLRQTGDGGFDAGNKQNTRNAARILRAWTYARLVDMYGNVPYSEANLGTSGIFFPKYDNGKAIYTDILKELDEAAAALNASDKDQASFAKADFVYKGDVTKWKKFAYSLMLRLALRAADADAALAGTYAGKAVTGGVMTSNADNFVVPMALSPSEWTNQNGISRAFYPGDGGQSPYLGQTLINFLKGTDPNSVADDDPRLMIISGGIGNWTANDFTIIGDGANPLNQKGMPHGLDKTDVDALEGRNVDFNTTYSKINVKLMQDDEPYVIMRYAEVEFMLALAKLKNLGGVAGTDKEHYEKGVKAAMQEYTIHDASLTVSDAAVTNYLSIYQYGVTKPAIQMIADQLWVANFLNWYEVWSYWRQLDFPVLVAAKHPSNITNGTIPVRIPYPTSETASNPNLATGGVTPDTYTTKVWWDTK